ncbi:GD14570 [Drosophila simulans]|uniref:GD14570 n=1 Tax=Drosophila simulans TaxID=7240 RepID=B4QL67_DROSI|nr:GD14570 [Drosophila simulans]
MSYDARRKFSLKAYGLLVLWLILALAQWLVIAFIEDAREIFTSLYYICLATFALAILIFALFIFIEKLRFINGLNFFMSLIIVELQIISTFALVAISWWADVLTFFGVALILMAIFLLIGVFLPADLTLDIAVLFILAFLFLIVASFILLFELLVSKTIPYAYLVVEISITFTILLFVMYHGQTINGNRFAEMRLNDYFLGSLILFHDFLIIFWLTFYWQIHYRPITPDSWLETSTPYYNGSIRTTNAYKSLDGGNYIGNNYTARNYIFYFMQMEQHCHRGSTEDLMTVMIVIQMQKTILRFQAAEEIQGTGTLMTQITFTDTGQIIGIPQKIGQFTIKGQKMDLGVVEGPELKVQNRKPYTTDIVSRTNGILNILRKVSTW